MFIAETEYLNIWGKNVFLAYVEYVSLMKNYIWPPEVQKGKGLDSKSDYVTYSQE